MVWGNAKEIIQLVQYIFNPPSIPHLSMAMKPDVMTPKHLDIPHSLNVCSFQNKKHYILILFLSPFSGTSHPIPRPHHSTNTYLTY